MKIGIFGGSLDPVTIGHINIVKDLKPKLDEIWVMPCYKSMFGKNMSSNEHRINMCKLAFDGIAYTSDFEIKNELTSGTYDCIKKMQAIYDDEFVLIIGKDNADVFDKWKHSTELKTLIPIWTINRPGYESNSYDKWYTKFPHQYFEDICYDVSSTLVRQRIKNNESIDGLITKEVFEYIKYNNMYIN